MMIHFFALTIVITKRRYSKSDLKKYQHLIRIQEERERVQQKYNGYMKIM